MCVLSQRKLLSLRLHPSSVSGTVAHTVLRYHKISMRFCITENMPALTVNIKKIKCSFFLFLQTEWLYPLVMLPKKRHSLLNVVCLISFPCFSLLHSGCSFQHFRSVASGLMAMLYKSLSSLQLVVPVGQTTHRHADNTGNCCMQTEQFKKKKE